MSKTASLASLLARLSLGVVLLVPAMSVHALELGRLDLHSALGQRLRADIPLNLGAHPDLQKIHVQLASQQEFAAAGLQWISVLDQVKFRTVERHGAYFVELRSDRPIQIPYLQFLLRLDWPGGRLVREYTALLDPPYLMNQEQMASTAPSVQVAVPTVPSSAPVPTVPPPGTIRILAPLSVQTATVPIKPLSVPTVPVPLLGPPNVKPLPAVPAGAGRKEVASSQSPKPRTIGPLKTGQSLWTVAKTLQEREQVGVPEIAVALYRANRHVFIHDNMNGLKRGTVLTVPSDAAVLSISQTEALRTLRVQDAAWNTYKAQMAGRPLLVASPHGPLGVATGSVQSTPPTETAGSQHLLKIVGAGAAVGTGGRHALSREAVTLQDALASKELENQHLQGRVQQLQQQLAATKRLLVIENRELTDLQVHSKGAQTVLTVPVAAAQPSPARTLATPAAVPKMPPAIPKPAVRPVPAARHPAIVPQPVLRESLVDNVMASPLFVPIAAALALLLAGFALYYRRRRQSIAEFEESILSGPISDPGSGSGDEAGKQTDASFLSDFSQGGMGNIHTDDVDPIAEAEVYLAYGRDEQAEEILKEAIVKDPARHELRLRLLEVYYQRKDLAAFETLAEELYAALEGKGGRIWSKVEDLGRKLSPSNPLFKNEPAPAEPVAVDQPADTLPLDLDTAVLAPNPNPVDVHPLDADTLVQPSDNEPIVASDDSVRFTLDLPAFGSTLRDTEMAEPVGSLDQVATNGSMVEFDLGLAPLTEGALQELGVKPAANDTDPGGLEWKLDMSGADASVHADPQLAGEPATDEVSAATETGTKLDLAKAYIDMGDAEGARSILGEVLVEGTDHQKAEARQLAATLT